MRVTFGTDAPATLAGDALALGVFDDLDFRGLPAARALEEAARALKFKGGEGEAFFAFDRGGRPPKHLLVVGLGKREEYGPSVLRAAAVLAVRRLRDRRVQSAGFVFPEEAGRLGDGAFFARTLTEGLLLGNSLFTEFLSEEDRRPVLLDRAVVCVAKKKAAFAEGLRIGSAVAEGVLLARRLVTLPANVLTPARMAEEARRVADDGGFSLKVLDRKACEKMGMGAYLAVARGSRNEPRFLHLSYRPKGAKTTLGLVGKGLTFDSGGLSLKPADGMGAMKSDMAGAAAVLGALKTVALLQPRVAVEAVMALCENMPGGDAYRPGDILTSLSGKTIEVLNTDAEGRLTLADALTYVQRQKVDAVVDLATLTGACVVALGPDFSGAMGNDQALLDEVLAAARESGDEIWPLPLPKAYNKFIKSKVADVANISRVRWGGALTAGLFLQKFVEEKTPWVHLDIAGPALRDEDGADANGAEGSGVGVRTLVNLLLGRSAE
jgi:leucyl aminopeptidase